MLYRFYNDNVYWLGYYVLFLEYCWHWKCWLVTFHREFWEGWADPFTAHDEDESDLCIGLNITSLIVHPGYTLLLPWNHWSVHSSDTTVVCYYILLRISTKQICYFHHLCYKLSPHNCLSTSTKKSSVFQPFTLLRPCTKFSYQSDLPETTSPLATSCCGNAGYDLICTYLWFTINTNIAFSYCCTCVFPSE